MEWIDVIPVIPLARGVPVRAPAMDDLRSTVIRVVAYDDGERVDHGEYDYDEDDCALFYDHGDALRVDLDDPQGFGYALRWLYSASACGRQRLIWRLAPGDDAPEPFDWPLVARALHGETTDADRLALAKALREVTE